MATSGHFSPDMPANPWSSVANKAAAVPYGHPNCRRFRPIASNKLPLDGRQSGDLDVSCPDEAFPAAAQTADLSVEGDKYDPESPWGARGIAYDPTSPYWTWKPRLEAPQPPMAHETAGHSIFRQLKTAAALVWPETEPAAEDPSSSDAAVSSGSILQILRDMESVPPTKVEENGPFAEEANGHIPYRFAVKEGDAASTTGTARTPKSKKRTARKSITAPNDGPRPKATKKSSPNAGSAPMPRCCPVEVPSILHMILDRTGDKLDPRMVEQYAGLVGKLCDRHLEKYRRLKVAMAHAQDSSGCPETPQTLQTLQSANPFVTPGSQTVATPVPVLPVPAPTPLTCHPQASPVPIPPIGQPVRKKRRSSTEPHRLARIPKAIGRNSLRPVPDVIRDSQYRKQVLLEIQERFSKAGSTDSQLLTHGAVTNRIVYNLLSVAKQPNATPERGPVDAHFLTGEEARAMLDAGSPLEPVVTAKEQMFRWQPRLRPTAELFRRMENLDRQVSVQVPSRSCMGDSFESRDLEEVRDRFLGSRPADKSLEEMDDPWNILDLRSPIPAAVLPQFLTCENCQLLPRLRDEVLNPSRAERDTATREQWNEWRDVLEWVLLSQGGHNTSPHTDSHGLGTWITVQEGLFGYGWLSRPTPDERAGWMADPQGYTGGRWCYLILEPGQTVFFNSGTVHFVFRLRSEPTLALGGHILQWTGIERWLQVVAAQMRNPHITNEDMEWSAPKYVRLVARLVEMRLRNGRVMELGGEPAIRRLLTLLKDFDETYMKERPRARPKRKKHR